MRPTALTVLLFGVATLLLAALTSGREATYGPGRSFASELHVGPGEALRVIEHETEDGRRTSDVLVSWPALLACLAVLYLTARGIAYLLERRRRGRPFTVLAGACAATLLLAAGAAAGFSLHYWGYAFTRPAPEDLVEDFAAVAGLSRVDCDLAGGPRCRLTAAEPVRKIVASCEEDPYYCLDERPVLALSRTGRPPADGRPAPAEAARALERFLASTDLLAEAEPGYEIRTLHGLVVAGRSAAGTPLAVASLSSGQVSNDHYPIYEVLFGGEEGGYRPLSQRRFYYDIAGLEGLEWQPAFLGLSVLGLAVSVPVTLVALIVLAYRGERRTDVTP